MAAEDLKDSNRINNRELEELQAQKAAFEANAIKHKFDLDYIKEDFL